MLSANVHNNVIIIVMIISVMLTILVSISQLLELNGSISKLLVEQIYQFMFLFEIMQNSISASVFKVFCFLTHLFHLLLRH
jgi:hypothetical protein